MAPIISIKYMYNDENNAEESKINKQKIIQMNIKRKPKTGKSNRF